MSRAVSDSEFIWYSYPHRHRFVSHHRGSKQRRAECLSRGRDKSGISREHHKDGWGQHAARRVYDRLENDLPLDPRLAKQLGIDGKWAGQDLGILLGHTAPAVRLAVSGAGGR